MKEIKKHDELISDLVDRLLKYDKYDIVSPFYGYKVGNLEGEVDVLAHNQKTGYWHFYEVKTTWHDGSKARAKKQYKRFCKAFDADKVKGVYVSNNQIGRLR